MRESLLDVHTTIPKRNKSVSKFIDAYKLIIRGHNTKKALEINDQILDMVYHTVEEQ